MKRKHWNCMVDWHQCSTVSLSYEHNRLSLSLPRNRGCRSLQNLSSPRPLPETWKSTIYRSSSLLVSISPNGSTAKDGCWLVSMFYCRCHVILLVSTTRLETLKQWNAYSNLLLCWEGRVSPHLCCKVENNSFKMLSVNTCAKYCIYLFLCKF